MCLFRKLGTGVSRQNIHIFCAQEGPKQIPQIFNIQCAMLNFLSLLGKVILFLALFISFPNLNQGLCGENSGTGIDEIKTDNSVDRAESDINIGAWFASFFQSTFQRWTETGVRAIPLAHRTVPRPLGTRFFVGWVMTVDRLIHEGDEGSVSPLVRRNGRLKILDPVRK